MVYHWRWWYSAPGLVLWAVLALAMVVPRANRTPQVLLILVPVCVVLLLWRIAGKILPFDSHDNEILGIQVHCIAVGLAVLWLLGHALGRGSWRATFLGALGVAAGVILIAALSFNLGPSDTTVMFLFLLVILMLAVVLGFALAGRLCRRRYSPWRFGVWLAAWEVLFSLVGMVLFFLGYCLVTADWPGYILPVLASAALGGFVLGACLFMVNLPFLIVGLRTPLFGERFLLCLRLNRPLRDSGDGSASEAATVQVPPDKSSV